MEDSKKIPLIQAADILSSTINYYFNKIYNGENIPEELKDIGKFLAGSYLVKDEFGESGFCDYFGSSKPLHDMFKENGLVKSENTSSSTKLDISPYLIT